MGLFHKHKERAVLGTGTIMINKGFLKPWIYQPENNPKKSGCFFVLLC